ncbi:monocarboxylate transporter 11 isoform X3 [Heptranchias perlo]|uniref:monocarboxylate transporter 11 isoform X3 n=1 Tax=Heptranchias perlo TaxID=212740 RepID=UPI003559EB78
MEDSKEIAMSKELRAADSATEDPNNSLSTPKYTDGGYGWVILASCFVTTGLAMSFVKSFGIFFLDIQEYFDVLAFKVSWISAINVAIFHLGSPIASALSLLLSHRPVIIVGGILSMLGLLLGSFGFSLFGMYLTTGFLVARNYTLLVIFSCICGFFFGTMLALLITVLADVMGIEKLDSALGLMMFFRSIGCLMGPPLAGLLVDFTGDYGNGFYFAGGGLFISACFLILTDYLMSREQKSIQGMEKEMEKFISQCQPQEEAEKEKLGTDRTNDTELGL